jgi:periplasmic copper chaperone A
MRPGRVPAATAVAVAATAVLVAGCGNSQPAVTQPGTIGANAKVGQVLLRDVEVTTGITGPSRDATVRLTLVNQAGQPDALTAVASDVAGRVEMFANTGCTATAARLALPPAGPSAQYTIRLRDLRIGLVRGGNVPITFTFANAGTITVPTPIGSDTAAPAGCAG